MTNTATRGSRNGRRESLGGSSVGGASSRVRKNSVANANVGGSGGLGANTTRPRANTISHIDLSSLGFGDGTNSNLNRMNALGITAGMGLDGSAAPLNFDYRGMSTSMGNHGNLNGLPKLDTNLNHADISMSLRTAPPQANFAGFDVDQLFTPHNTINPAALHFGSAANLPSSALSLGAFDMNPNQQVSMDDDFGWMRSWNMQMASGHENEQAIDESSPSRMSSGDSPGDYTESMTNSTVGIPIHSNFQWSHQDIPPHSAISTGPFQLEALGTGLPNVDPNGSTASPVSLQDPTPTADAYFHQAMMQQNGQQQPHRPSQPEIVPGAAGTFFGPALSNFGSNSPSISSSSMTGSARQSSVTSMSTDSINDSTRQALLTTLSQPSVFGGHNPRKYSQPSVSSPLSPGNARSSAQNQGPTLPSTADIRRYIEAFIQYANPHLPVTHIPTLSFESIEPTAAVRGSSPGGSSTQIGANGGARCLILGMAAIGALYEYDHPASKDLFEAAKKMISLYLEERRRADMSAAVNGSSTGGETPLWLVQAMLLTVIYGHQCGDRTAADIASNHIAALVSLARAANLARPPMPVSPSAQGEDSTGQGNANSGDVDMGAGQAPEIDLHAQWIKWKDGEERKRILFAIFILSSLLTTAYNQTPTIMNSEILLDLPCDEDLYNAESAQEWQNRGGLAAAERNSISFAVALSTLLTASQRSSCNYSRTVHNTRNPLGALQAGENFAENDLRPSTFGCLVLINALHNYIWETRNRHHGKEWTLQETESMFAHIEPALNAWQAAWKANEHHRLERPNPFGLGPLSADSIPLLDLAFVRLFVNLGRTAEAFWRRDFDGMADELARGSDIMIAASSPTEDHDHTTSNGGTGAAHNSPAQLGNGTQTRASPSQSTDQASSRRERHLRKAAFYAADSMTIACSFNLTYVDPTAHELPIQSAICFFDCTQVLAEWATTVQERVGRYLGVLGRDSIEYTQVPAIMLLDTEDVELLRKIELVCNNMEAKRLQQENLLALDIHNFNPVATINSMQSDVDLSACGFGSKIMRVTAMMLEKAVIWPSKFFSPHISSS